MTLKNRWEQECDTGAKDKKRIDSKAVRSADTGAKFCFLISMGDKAGKVFRVFSGNSGFSLEIRGSGKELRWLKIGGDHWYLISPCRSLNLKLESGLEDLKEGLGCNKGQSESDKQGAAHSSEF
ncbi:hypothetical protein VNO77_05334 [Canavalia gladiata]|uniref:Uncharacterized protein n=1 Tax=Canavalia gladiata TaxID=3824 RepID=A0AAN9N3D1_CANGL